MTFSVIVPVLYNFKGCVELFQSIDEECVPIIVDNWNANRGVAGGWNEGIRQSLDLNISKFVIVNDDVTFEKGSRPSQLIKELDMSTGFVLGEVGFACFATSHNAISTIGWFDEEFSPAYFEDNDFAYRTKLANMSYKAIVHCKVKHVGSATQFWHGQGDNERTVSHEQFRANRAYYQRKWGGDPGYERYKIPFDGLEQDV